MTIILETNDFLAVDKESGLASIPERDLDKPSLLTILARERGEKLFVVHRLDKEASGVIVFARNAEAHRWLNDAFASRKVEKQYTALVHGLVAAEEGRIDRGVRQYGSGRMGIDDAGGKRSVTLYRVKERFEAHTLLEAQARTGRRHQLRVHLYSIGHPIVGDPMYGDRGIQRAYPRLMLHASRLAFPDRGGARRVLESALPGSFLTVLGACTRAPQADAAIPE